MRKIFLSLFIFHLSLFSFSQMQDYKCYPTHWWVGMKNPFLQVMMHGEHIGSGNFSISYPGIKLQKVYKPENPNYVFIDLLVTAAARPGTIKIKRNDNGQSSEMSFELKPRRTGKSSNYAQGVTSKDFIYLIMPDRFSNGDETNDRVPGMRDQTLRRDTVFNRHGGDLKGVANKLDYLRSLGVTTIWLNPVIENDMPNRTEHGYAFTDHYKVDPRLGGDKAYYDLVEAAHKKGLKVIQDAVYNHIGIYHFTVEDQPMKDWLHQWPAYTNTSYKDQVLIDPHGSNLDKKIMADGWFTKQMPDLNQYNPYVANYLIQHAIWSVEEFGIDGWRIDTYAYNDLEFMNRCNMALENEYPKITMFGETWVHGVPNQSYFVQNNYNIPFKSNLQAPTDFQTLWGITDAMTRDFGWTDGVNNLYTTLAQDFVYKDPMRNVIFLDNHDMARFYSVVGENMEKYKSALNWLLTCRGIPQLYYGDEIGLTGFTSPNDGYVRQDFPGGWPSDAINKFNNEGRTEKEREIWDHISRLANYRRNSSAITTGKMMQFVPEDAVYVYFRYDASQTVMVVMNTSKVKKQVALKRFAERTNGFSKMRDIITGKLTGIQDISLDAWGSSVFELLK